MVTKMYNMYNTHLRRSLVANIEGYRKHKGLKKISIRPKRNSIQ